MSLQNALNQEALGYCPLIKKAIRESSGRESNQMFHIFIEECLNAQPCIADMSKESLKEFEGHCIDIFIGLGLMR